MEWKSANTRNKHRTEQPLQQRPTASADLDFWSRRPRPRWVSSPKQRLWWRRFSFPASCVCTAWLVRPRTWSWWVLFYPLMARMLPRVYEIANLVMSLPPVNRVIVDRMLSVYPVSNHRLPTMQHARNPNSRSLNDRVGQQLSFFVVLLSIASFIFDPDSTSRVNYTGSQLKW